MSTGEPERVLAGLLARAKANRRYDIGFPGATDISFADLAEWLTGQLLNNIGDPWDVGHGRNHTKPIEQQVVHTIAGLLRAPEGHWGYITTGATEGTLHALDDAWQRYPDCVVYASAAAHYSVAKAARLLKLPLVLLRTDDAGRMDIDHLRRELLRRYDRAAMIVATAGTTMTEAVDDVAAITTACDELGIQRRRIHVDAALSGVPLALLPEPDRPSFDFTAGATSMVVSGHKFLSTLTPCGVLIYKQPPYATGSVVAYTGSIDTTITGSRSGHTPLLLWWVLATQGEEGLRRRAEDARALAIYTHDRLREIGWPTGRNRHAFTVTLASPPPAVRAKWVLADDGQVAHIICMPGVTRPQIDEFLTDLTVSAAPAQRLKRLDSGTPFPAVVQPARRYAA